MTDTLDAASILFPNDVPAASRPPEWFKAEQSAAEQRLMGGAQKKPDPAAVLFPNEGPKDTTINPDDPVEKQIFKDETRNNVADYERTVSGELNAVLISAVQDGNTEQADEIRTAITGLSSDFAKAGTDQQTLTDALRIVKGDSIVLPTHEQIEVEYEQRLSELPEMGVSDDDLRIARQFVSDLEVVSPGLKRSLEISGKGNDPKLIKMAIAEARRRNYR